MAGAGINIAFEAVERHAHGDKSERAAFRFLGAEPGTINVLSYGELSLLSNRFANALKNLGVSKGDRLFILASRIPELYIALLGSLKIGTVVCPLFSAFGPGPGGARRAGGGAE